ncbi:hypothetical protein HXX76_012795 [Chlamydomonas incerta]|uniref:Uncharacterized protein n=1 Tax=Chlamydomonas incerta TaxID=51695 RepID=A0A835SKM7_CHLIN|nr:hypothetical protein HXX76_012795 [Chlamydomonas incerta]|eukprot:KAG2426737.1 hypothetical protein HXX76_012795 [Chlamydomonas incerta]
MQRCAASPASDKASSKRALQLSVRAPAATGSARPLLPAALRGPRRLWRGARCQALGPGGGKGPEKGEGPIRRLAQQAERHAHQLLDSLTPKAEYDFADVFLIFLSTLVFMWVAAELYRLYAFSYYASGGGHAAGTFMGH